MATESTINIGSGGGDITWTATSDPANPNVSVSVTSGSSFLTASGTKVTISQNGSGGSTGNTGTQYTIMFPPGGSHYGVADTCAVSITASTASSSSSTSSRSGSVNVTASTTATTGYNGTASVTSAYTISQSGAGAGQNTATAGYYISMGSSMSKTGANYIMCNPGDSVSFHVAANASAGGTPVNCRYTGPGGTSENYGGVDFGFTITPTGNMQLESFTMTTSY